MGGGILWKAITLTYKLNNLSWQYDSTEYDEHFEIVRFKCDLSRISKEHPKITKYKITFNRNIDGLFNLGLELRSSSKIYKDPMLYPMIFEHRYEDAYEYRIVTKKEKEVIVEYSNNNYITSLDKIRISSDILSVNELKKRCESLDFTFTVLESIK